MSRIIWQISIVSVLRRARGGAPTLTARPRAPSLRIRGRQRALLALPSEDFVEHRQSDTQDDTLQVRAVEKGIRARGGVLLRIGRHGLAAREAHLGVAPRAGLRHLAAQAVNVRRELGLQGVEME